MYTLGGLMISSDDDMRPYALMEDSPESLESDEIARGRLHKAGLGHYVHKSFDIIGAFKDVLGKPVAELPENYERGEMLVDSARAVDSSRHGSSRVRARQSERAGRRPGAVARARCHRGARRSRRATEQHRAARTRHDD